MHAGCCCCLYSCQVSVSFLALFCIVSVCSVSSFFWKNWERDLIKTRTFCPSQVHTGDLSLLISSYFLRNFLMISSGFFLLYLILLHLQRLNCWICCWCICPSSSSSSFFLRKIMVCACWKVEDYRSYWCVSWFCTHWLKVDQVLVEILDGVPIRLDHEW